MTASDRCLFEELIRFHLVTSRSLAVSPFAGRSGSSIERLIGRNLRYGRIVAYPLYGATKYYTFTQKGARAAGLSTKRFGRSFGLQSLCQNYAMLAFSRLEGTKHQPRMTRAEFVGRFPQLVGQGLSSSRYFLDADGDKVRLSLLIPDFNSEHRRLVRKVRHEVRKRFDHRDQKVRGAFRRLMEDDQFSITVLTPFPEKAARIEKGLEHETFHHRVAVVTDFAQLLIGGMS